MSDNAARQEHLYRGTTRNWPGNPVLQKIAVTPTSMDPVVAALFAVRCRRFGEAILQLAPFDALSGKIGQANVFKELECEVAIELAPTDFTSMVVYTITAMEAHQALETMGIEIPRSIATAGDLTYHLKNSPRMSKEDIMKFDELVRKMQP